MSNTNVTVRINAQDNFSGTLDRLKRGLTGAADGAKQAQSSLDRLKTGFDAVMGSAVVAGAVRLGQEMYELGNSVRVASATFTQLAGGADQAAGVMDQLRAATGGAVDNLTLMQAGTKYLSMGLAENSTELARLTELAVKLGGAMGNDASSSIENFGLLLANESVLRLDTFGISSARVRERIDELLASGQALSRSDAFRMAVLEEGGRSLDRLGMSADAAMGSMERLGAVVQNVGQDLAYAWTQILRAAADTTMMGIDLGRGVVTRLVSDAQTAAQARAAGAAVAQQFADGFAGLSADQVGRIGQMYFEGLLTNQFTAGGGAPSSLIGQMSNSLFPSFMGMGGPTDADVNRIKLFVNALNDQVRATQAVMLTRQQMALFSDYESPRQVSRYTQPPEEVAAGYLQSYFDRIRQTYIDVADVSITGRMTSIEPPEFFNPERLSAVQNAMLGINQYMSQIQELNAQGIVSDDDLRRFQEMASSAEDMTSSLEGAAAAVKDMTLQQALFGGSDPNELLGGVMGQLLTGVDTSGWSQSTLDNLALATGEATPSSLALNRLMERLRTRFAPYGQRGADNLVGAGQTITDFLRVANIQGLGQDQIAAGLGAFETFGTGSQGQSRALAAAGLDPASLEAARTGVDSVTESLSTAVTEAERIDEALTTISRKGYDIPINFTMTGDSPIARMIMTLLAGGGGGSGTGTDTVNNNGRPPGSSNTGGRSQTVTQPIRRTRGPE